ncbi:MAG: metal-sensing transcriptional repressor [Treponema sp.]|nr:metal-sensing transcriptional repressor [Treponema sp.]MBE6353189.1 metal-sensing transcriptional repressor [Treponema sp.]
MSENQNIDLCCEEIEQSVEAETSCPHCSGKHKKRDVSEYKDLMNRLKRIEGQVRGVEGMLENNAYCTDILVQVCAVTSALNSFNKALLANHMKTCVAEGIRRGDDSVIDEFVVTLQKLMK